ncbi:hypothetical protein BC938DRAFT_471647 [Jimgerdemannia flammicorona]|uniref:Uncharacterized protein n=1 Tax=Jimgerdemannia flammicorona TaxID=994334 RepID=A0A433R018_9FUNG|nr:hypothetical protein BC938DRAFT_471647 [Jimgerdemannia flammicorona]
MNYVSGEYIRSKRRRNSDRWKRSFGGIGQLGGGIQHEANVNTPEDYPYNIELLENFKAKLTQNEQGDSLAQAEDVVYQNCVTFLQSTLLVKLTTAPSRILITSILNASKAKGKAVVDGLLLPLVHGDDVDRCSDKSHQRRTERDGHSGFAKVTIVAAMGFMTWLVDSLRPGGGVTLAGYDCNDSPECASAKDIARVVQQYMWFGGGVTEAGADAGDVCPEAWIGAVCGAVGTRLFSCGKKWTNFPEERDGAGAAGATDAAADAADAADAVM